jgi:methyl-accepting chemotaxis protein
MELESVTMAHAKPQLKNRKNVEPNCAPDRGMRLQSRVRLFVMLIVCAYVIFSLAMLFDLSEQAGPRHLAKGNHGPPQSTLSADSPQPVVKKAKTDDRTQLWIFFTMLITAVALFATYFYPRKLLGPLEEVRLTAGRIAGGQLNQPAAIRNRDEIGAIAELINDIAANQQEILLHLWNQTGHSLDLIDRIKSGIVHACPNDGLVRVNNDLSSVRHSMESLRALADNTGFYQVRLQEGKACATSEDPSDKSRHRR